MSALGERTGCVRWLLMIAFNCWAGGLRRRTARRAWFCVLAGLTGHDQLQGDNTCPWLSTSLLVLPLTIPPCQYTGCPADQDNPLPHFIDPITMSAVVRPAISPYGHVAGLATWKVR